MRRLARCPAAPWFLPRAALAGVGGRATLTARGDDPRAERVRPLETATGEGEALPRIYFMPPGGPRRGALVRACDRAGLRADLLARECRHVAGAAGDPAGFYERRARLRRGSTRWRRFAWASWRDGSGRADRRRGADRG